MSSINIYGAGISGLTAAILLARNGYDVTVHEKEIAIGGSLKCTPSVHMTPLDFVKMKEYIGFDVKSCFSEISQFKAYIYSKIVYFNPTHLYVTERGANTSSLDYFLYTQAQKDGVNVVFEDPLTKEKIQSLADGTIIATGGYSCLSKYFKISHFPYVFFKSHEENKGKRNYCLAYFEPYLASYGYIAANDNVVSAQAGFLLDKPYEKLLDRFKDRLKNTEQLKFDKWSMVYDHFPVGTNLLKKIHGKTIILAGAMSGLMDPFFGFGVNSALISGKIAALTTMSRKKGKQEFKRITTNLNRMYLLSRVYDFIPFKQILIPKIFGMEKDAIPVIGKNLQNMTGFIDDDCFKIQKITPES